MAQNILETEKVLVILLSIVEFIPLTRGYRRVHGRVDAKNETLAIRGGS